MEDIILRPGNVYNIGKDIPRGYYIFRINSLSEIDHDARFICYQRPPSESSGQHFRAFWGVAHVDNTIKYAEIRDGIAVYYGDCPFDLYALLSAQDMEEGKFSQEGLTVLSYPLGTVKVHKYDYNHYLFHGASDMEVSEQYIFSIDDMFFWMGLFNPQSYKDYTSIEFSLDREHTSNVFSIDKRNNHTLFKNSILFSVSDHSVCWYHQKGKDYFSDKTLTVVQLPKREGDYNISLHWIKPSCCKERLIYTTDPIYSFYVDDFVRLYDVLERYTDLGIPINVKEELNRFKKFPDFIPVCCPVLENILDTFDKMQSIGGDPSINVFFQITARYDKRFYCAAKLADHAVEIKSNVTRTVYHVTFTGDQLNEIRLMYNNLANFFNQERDYIVFARNYLRSRDGITYIKFSLSKFEEAFRKLYGFHSFVRNSAVRYLRSAIHELSQIQLDALYKEMISEGRVKSKWASEYTLYMLLSQIFSDAVYQYHTAWLGQQSLDIFVPSLALAVEYQGQQHFEVVEHFGGETGLHDRIARDNLKRQLCLSNGIKLLEWKYDRAVTWENAIAFLEEHNIGLPTSCAKDAGDVEIKVNRIVPAPPN